MRSFRRSLRIGWAFILSSCAGGCWGLFGLPVPEIVHARSEKPVLQAHRYEPASLGRKLVFPRDHGAHREFAYEWWYFTGHLFAPESAPEAAKDSSGAELAGFELTVFRVSPVAGPKTGSYLMAHLALSDLERKTFRFTSFGLKEREGLAQVSDRNLLIRMPGIKIELLPDGRTLNLQTDVKLGTDRFRLSGELRSNRPVTLQGDEGYSRKGQCPSCASHYSSFPRLTGELALNGRKLRSQVWFDHEFGSNSLAEGQIGWDWFALQLKNGWDVMLFQLRDAQGKPSFTSGSMISPEGKTVRLDPSRIRLEPRGKWTSPGTGAVYPAHWKVSVEGGPIPLEGYVLPKLADQEIRLGQEGLATYWEGTCDLRTEDQLQGGSSIGNAYLEMTGYDPKNRPRF